MTSLHDKAVYGELVSQAGIGVGEIHNGQSEVKQAMKMGGWYMAGYDLGHAGEHQVMVLFKTADGAKHKGGIYYPG